MRQTLRHITVGGNCYFATGGNARPRAYHGNFWIKRGGRHGGNGATAFVGKGHVFFRNDNTGRLNVYAYRENPGTVITQYFAFNKGGPDVSVEILGHSRARTY